MAVVLSGNRRVSTSVDNPHEFRPPALVFAAAAGSALLPMSASTGSLKSSGPSTFFNESALAELAPAELAPLSAVPVVLSPVTAPVVSTTSFASDAADGGDGASPLKYAPSIINRLGLRNRLGFQQVDSSRRRRANAAAISPTAGHGGAASASAMVDVGVQFSPADATQTLAAARQRRRQRRSLQPVREEEATADSLSSAVDDNPFSVVSHALSSHRTRRRRSDLDEATPPMSTSSTIVMHMRPEAHLSRSNADSPQAPHITPLGQKRAGAHTRVSVAVETEPDVDLTELLSLKTQIFDGASGSPSRSSGSSKASSSRRASAVSDPRLLAGSFRWDSDAASSGTHSPMPRPSDAADPVDDHGETADSSLAGSDATIGNESSGSTAHLSVSTDWRRWSLAPEVDVPVKPAVEPPSPKNMVAAPGGPVVKPGLSENPFAAGAWLLKRTGYGSPSSLLAQAGDSTGSHVSASGGSPSAAPADTAAARIAARPTAVPPASVSAAWPPVQRSRVDVTAPPSTHVGASFESGDSLRSALGVSRLSETGRALERRLSKEAKLTGPAAASASIGRTFTAPTSGLGDAGILDVPLSLSVLSAHREVSEDDASRFACESVEVWVAHFVCSLADSLALSVKSQRSESALTQYVCHGV
jgi:hypothetical protein